MTQFKNDDDARSYLITLGQKDDCEIDLIETGFAFSLLENSDIDIKKYRDHIQTLCDDLKTAFDDIAANENSDNVYVQVKSLATVMAQKHRYLGDDIHYDDLQNINLFSVIDRRVGIPITLCMVAIEICRAQGWNAEGVNFPGHFLMRLEKDGERVIVDPFQGCKILEAKDLRVILKRVVGDNAELSANYYEPCTNREVLLRLQNNIKFRLIDSEQYDRALNIVETMSWVAPDDYRLCLDRAVLLSRLEQPQGAIDNIKIYLNHITDPQDRAEAEIFLSQLQKQIN